MERRSFVRSLLAGLALAPATLLIDIPKAKAPPLPPTPRIMVREKWVRTGYAGEVAFLHTRSYVDGGRVQQIQDHVASCPFISVHDQAGTSHQTSYV